MKICNLYFSNIASYTLILLLLVPFMSLAGTDQIKATSSGELSFTVRTVTQNGNFAPKHVLAIWIEDTDGFVKTRLRMANQRKQYLYTWVAASNYNVVDAITGSTLTSHQTHTVSWDCTDLDGEIVPDGDYVVWVEFTEKHAQGPLYSITFTKGSEPQSFTPADETYFKDIELEFTPFVSDFSTDETAICQLESVVFTDESVNASSWEWSFGEGADPATSTSQGPHTVTYSTQGNKTVSLTINGSITETKENLIVVTAQPEADFTFAGMDLTVEFSNNTTNATAYLWDFGDGNTSEEDNPTHTYAVAGAYIVTLSASNLDCVDDFSQEVAVPLTGIVNTNTDNLFEIYPNPNNGVFEIRIAKNYYPESIQVLDQSGKIIITLESFDSNVSNIPVNLGDAKSGIYYLMIVSKGKTMSKKIILQ